MSLGSCSLTSGSGGSESEGSGVLEEWIDRDQSQIIAKLQMVEVTVKGSSSPLEMRPLIFVPPTQIRPPTSTPVQIQGPTRPFYHHHYPQPQPPTHPFLPPPPPPFKRWGRSSSYREREQVQPSPPPSLPLGLPPPTPTMTMSMDNVDKDLPPPPKTRIQEAQEFQAKYGIEGPMRPSRHWIRKGKYRKEFD